MSSSGRTFAFFTLLFCVSICSAATSPMVVKHSRQAAPTTFSLQGPAASNDSVTIRMALTSNNRDGLQQKLNTISDPANSEYGKWLNQDEIKAFVQPSSQTLAAVQSWASQNNLKTESASSNGNLISFTVNYAQANALFNASFNTYTHTPTGEQVVRTLSYSVPQELAAHVQAIHPGTTFTNPKSIRFAPVPTKMHWSRQSKVDAQCSQFITPACLTELYGISTAPATSKNNALFVTGYEDQFAIHSDLQLFLKNFQPQISPNTDFQAQGVDGGLNNQNQPGDEANLDIQYTVGIANGVPTTFLSFGGQDFGGALLDTTTFLLDTKTPPTVITTSYGDNEDNFDPAIAQQICDNYMAVGARGISVLYSSGDGGVRGGHDTPDQCVDNTFIPVFPASCPYITSVGSTVGIAPETAANFSSGGFSNLFKRPSFQDSAVTTFLQTLPKDFAGQFNQAGRGFPDVATQGVDFAVVNGGQATKASGTSASSPTFASIISLINDKLIAAGKPQLGFLNPFIYSKGVQGFTDITEGSNPGLTCDNTATSFTAVKGWEPINGLGTPIFPKLLQAALGQ